MAAVVAFVIQLEVVVLSQKSVDDFQISASLAVDLEKINSN